MSHMVTLSIEDCNVLAELEEFLGDKEAELVQQHEDLNDQINLVREKRSAVQVVLSQAQDDGFLWMNAPARLEPGVLDPRD